MPKLIQDQILNELKSFSRIHRYIPTLHELSYDNDFDFSGFPVGGHNEEDEEFNELWKKELEEEEKENEKLFKQKIEQLTDEEFVDFELAKRENDKKNLNVEEKFNKQFMFGDIVHARNQKTGNWVKGFIVKSNIYIRGQQTYKIQPYNEDLSEFYSSDILDDDDIAQIGRNS